MAFVMLITLICVPLCRAGFDQNGAGGRGHALGGALTAVGGDLWSAFFNVAGLSRVQRDGAAFFYAPSPFGLPELAEGAASVAIRTRAGVVGIAGRKFGSDLYRELTASLSFAGSLPPAEFGISLNYYSVRIARYGSAGAAGVDAGLLAEVTREVRLGLSVRNVTAARIGLSGEPIPQICALGASYAPAPALLVSADVRKESGVGAYPLFGFEYRVVRELALRGGWSGSAALCTAGVGIRLLSLTLDYTVAVHQELGWTHEATISVEWGGTP